MLLLLVPGVLAVLTDQQDTIHVETIAAASKGTDDARIDGNIEFTRDVSADVFSGKLIDVDRGNLGTGRQQALVGGKAMQKLRDDDIGVGTGLVLGDDGGDLLHFMAV